MIPISFEQSAYAFQERDALIDSVFVVKDDVVTEQNITLLVHLSTNDVTKEGKETARELEHRANWQNYQGVAMYLGMQSGTTIASTN